MYNVVLILGLGALVGAFGIAAFTKTHIDAYKLGKQAGAEDEAQGIASSLKVAALVREDYRAVIADLKAKETAALARIKALL
jgi:hypothetical protein